MRLLDLFTSQVVELPDLVKCDGDTAERMLNARFNKVKSRLQPCIAPNSQRCSDTKEEPMLDIWTFARFSCPEEGCVKKISNSLQHHLDLGEHKRTLENEKLLDRAVLGYADRLQEQLCGSI